jgi:uncharacterized membrane protein YfcA
MTLLVAALAALLGAGLTFFSGFGLGTLLLGVLVLILPPAVAIAVTAVVHLLNNLFKLGLVGRHAAGRVVARFGGPAIVGAFAGASLLDALGEAAPLATFTLGAAVREVSPVKLAIGLLLVAFAVFEVSPLRHAALPPSLLPVGGLVSGFFGGLSGHQGALRSVFLLRAGLSKDAFIATGVAIAVLIDLTRLSTYAADLRGLDWRALGPLVGACTAAAFAGSYLGSRLLPKLTYAAVQRAVAALLLLIGLGLASGLL